MTRGVWSLGLARWAAHLDRDLQRASRVAGGPAALWSASTETLARATRLDPARTGELLALRRDFNEPEERAALQRLGIDHIGHDADEYPARLAAIPDPPFGLFVRGCGRGVLAHAAERPIVAIVGSRRATSHGVSFARSLARDLATRGAVVVSGLARGIDTAAHEGALDGGGMTIAVVGCGVDVVYPRSNRTLVGRILDAGSPVVGEYWPSTPPAPWRFPARNRIVCGLSDAVVVVEAATRSGALITADFALDVGRPVLAVPGFPGAVCSSGCNALIKSGAAVCEGVDDVAAEIPSGTWSPLGTAPRARPPDGTAGRIYERLAREPLRPDQIAATLDLPPAEVAGALALLEVEGLALRGEGQRYWAAPLRGAA
jgi:DNA processing protein